MASGKRLKLVVAHFHPEVNALTNRLDSLLPLLGNEHSISAVYLTPTYPSVEEVLAFNRRMGVEIDHVPVVLVSYEGSRLASRVIGETRNSWRLWRAAVKVDADILYQSVPPLMLLPVSALFVPFDKASRKIVELRDLTWEYIDFGSGIAARVAKRLLAWVAAFSVRRFDEAVTCTKGQEKFVTAQARIPTTVVSNGISMEKFEQLSSLHRPARGSTVRVCYFGTFGFAQNLKTLISAAMQLVDMENVVFELVGSGPEERALRAMVQRVGLSNVKFVGKMPWQELLAYYANADVLYAQLKDGKAFETAEPSKLFEYFATGKPVVFGGKGLARELATQFENATVVDPDDPTALAEAVRSMVGRPLQVCTKDIDRVRSFYVREKIFENFLVEADLL